MRQVDVHWRLGDERGEFGFTTSAFAEMDEDVIIRRLRQIDLRRVVEAASAGLIDCEDMLGLDYEGTASLCSSTGHSDDDHVWLTASLEVYRTGTNDHEDAWVKVIVSR